jgi:Spy/CpxP family protein refolding chaperone
MRPDDRPQSKGASMRTRSFVLGVAATIVTAGIAVVVAQHREGAGAPAQSRHPMEMIHSLCADPAAPDRHATKPHLPEHLTKAIELTATQQADIERKVGEACAAMSRLHEDIMNILTPAQRTKLRELHGGGHADSGIHGWLKKLHGGD